MSADKHRAYVGLGANLGDRAATLRAAATALEALGSVTARSSLYETRPWGDPDQPEYVNAVVRLETALPPLALLRELQALEARLGRRPSRAWGPRAIDLDILTYDDREIDEAGPPPLRVPHPHLALRAFVLVPLTEIDGAFAPLLDALSADERAGVRLLRE